MNRLLALLISIFVFKCACCLHLVEPALAHDEESQHGVPNIVITADPLAPSLLEYGQPVTVIEKDELVTKTETTIGETLQYEPGVSSSYFGPGSSRPVIRGKAGDRIRVLKNGTGTLDISNTSEDHQVGLNPLSADRIEILRGPETLLYGSSAIGGVVNVIDNSIPEQSIEKPYQGSVDFRTGTADDELTGATSIEGGIGRFNYHIDGFYQDTNDIDIPGNAESDKLLAEEEAAGEEHEEDEESNGKLPNSFTRSRGFNAGGSYTSGEAFLGAAVSGYRSRYGVPGHVEGEEESQEEEARDEGEEEEENVSIDLEQWRVELRGGIDNVSDFARKLRFNAAYVNYDHVENEGAEAGTRFENDAFEIRTELNHGNLGPLEGVVGLQFEYSEFSAVGEEAFVVPTDRFSPAVFFFEEMPLADDLMLQFGGRYEHVAYDANTFSSDNFNPFSVSGGVSWDPTGDDDYTVGLQLAYAQRAPSAIELYSDGAHLARQIFEQGNPNLDEEASFGADLTFKKNYGLVTGELNLFVQHYPDDYINLAGTGEEEDGFPVFAYEGVEALFWGFETESTLHIHNFFDPTPHTVELTGQFDFVRARNLDDSEDLPRIPPFRTLVELEYSYQRMYSASIEGVFVAAQTDTAGFELPTSAYQLLNATVEAKLPKWQDRELTLYVRGTNLTDEEARIHSSFLKDLAPLRGASVLFGIRAVF